MAAKFWAKTGAGKLRGEGSPEYHPVICHLADTAAVAMEIVRSHLSSITRKHLAKGLGLPDDEALVRFCGFMAGSHDLGKVSPAFQFQVSEVGKALVGQSIYDLWQGYPTTGQKTPHGIVTAATLPEFLTALGLPKCLARRLAVIVGGHHGFFPGSADIQSVKGQADDMGRGDWQKFRKSTYEQLQGFVGLIATDLPNQCDDAADLTLQQIRGLEGVRVRTLYSRLSKETGVEWKGRNYKQDEWNDANSINKALSLANACLYAVCQAALTSVGYSMGLGFIHTGKPLSFVYDIADMYKGETSIPAAFEAVADTYFDLEEIVRRKCREKFFQARLIQRIIQDVDQVLQYGGADETVEPTCFLWDDQLEQVEGGKDWSEE